MKKLLLLFLLSSSLLSAQLYVNNTSTVLADAAASDACGSGALTPGITTSIINVPIAAQVSDPNLVIFSLGITHSWVTDLTVEITSPTTSTCALLKRVAAATLADNGCGASSNFLAANVLNFSSAYATLFVPSTTSATNNPGGNFAPSGQAPTAYPAGVTLCTLSTFLNNLAIQGNWELKITDTGGGDTGTLETWSINFQPGSLLGNPDFGAIYASTISVMQNPFGNQLTLRANEQDLESLSFDVYAIDGKLVHSGTLASFNSERLLTIDTSSWSSGTYVLVPTKNEKFTQTLKIVKN